jgi:hypothetical protein
MGSEFIENIHRRARGYSPANRIDRVTYRDIVIKTTSFTLCTEFPSNARSSRTQSVTAPMIPNATSGCYKIEFFSSIRRECPFSGLAWLCQVWCQDVVRKLTLLAFRLCYSFATASVEASHMYHSETAFHYGASPIYSLPYFPAMVHYSLQTMHSRMYSTCKL